MGDQDHPATTDPSGTVPLEPTAVVLVERLTATMNVAGFIIRSMKIYSDTAVMPHYLS